MARVLGPGRDLTPLARARARAAAPAARPAALGRRTVAATLDGHPVTIDLEVVEEYLDGEIDRAALTARWRADEAGRDARRRPGARGDDRRGDAPPARRRHHGDARADAAGG